MAWKRGCSDWAVGRLANKYFIDATLSPATCAQSITSLSAGLPASDTVALVLLSVALVLLSSDTVAPLRVAWRRRRTAQHCRFGVKREQQSSR